ncbi:kinase [Prevotella falsenii]|uniref:kinase n=1 Tax=Prevotella falsenii TaxID=515414 RepID=UPI00046979EB|nr:kinase [Prevotella falsenii]
MEYYNKMLCVTREELIGGSDPVMKMGTFNSNLYRKRIVPVYAGGGEENFTLYSFDSMPEKYRKRFMQKYGNPEDVLREREMRKAVKYDECARAFYEEYQYLKNDVYTTLDEELKAEYTTNASVLGELLRMKAERRAMMASLNARATDVWEVVLQNSEALRERYHHTLPASLSRLKARIRAFQKDGYESVVSKKLGNANTIKITEEGKEVLIALKRSYTPRYTDAQIFEKYNELAAIRKWKPLKSVRSLQAWLYSPKVEQLWYDAVHGEQAARQRFGRKQSTILPERRDSLWYGDGTKLNLYYREGKEIKTINVYEVVDAYSEVLLGFHISESENFEAQYCAFRMAVQRSGHKPYEIVHDNQGGHNKLNRQGKKPTGDEKEKGFLDRLCHIHRPTMPHNGESKTIENIFGRFQQQVLARYFNFTGQNVTAKKLTSRPNMEMVAANRDNMPTLLELCEIYAQCREEWNAMKHPKHEDTRIALYEQSVNEETPAVGKYEMQDMFWIMSEKPVTFTDSGIKMMINKKQYHWEVFTVDENGVQIPDREWRRLHTWEKFYVQYDPQDMTTVNLYSIDRAKKLHFCTVAKPYMQVHRAMQDQSAEEKARIHADIERGKQDRIERVAAGREIAQRYGTDPEQNGLYYPKLKGLTAEQQQQLYDRVGRLEKDSHAEVVELGQHTKKLSNMDWSEVQYNERKTVEKL